VGPLGLSAKLANSIERSNTLYKTRAPLDLEAVRNADAACGASAQGRNGVKYQLSSQSEYQLEYQLLSNALILLATPVGIEPTTFSLEGCCSIRWATGPYNDFNDLERVPDFYLLFVSPKSTPPS
jgi:hypothetical protein